MLNNCSSRFNKDPTCLLFYELVIPLLLKCNFLVLRASLDPPSVGCLLFSTGSPFKVGEHSLDFFIELLAVSPTQFLASLYKCELVSFLYEKGRERFLLR